MAHAALNLKEEVGNAAADLTKTVTNGNHFEDVDTKFVSCIPSLIQFQC